MATRSGYDFIQFVAISGVLLLSCISNNSTSSGNVTPKTAAIFSGSDDLKRDTNDTQLDLRREHARLLYKHTSIKDRQACISPQLL